MRADLSFPSQHALYSLRLDVFHHQLLSYSGSGYSEASICTFPLAQQYLYPCLANLATVPPPANRSFLSRTRGVDIPVSFSIYFPFLFFLIIFSTWHPLSFLSLSCNNCFMFQGLPPFWNWPELCYSTLSDTFVCWEAGWSDSMEYRRHQKRRGTKEPKMSKKKKYNRIWGRGNLW